MNFLKYIFLSIITVYSSFAFGENYFAKVLYVKGVVLVHRGNVKTPAKVNDHLREGDRITTGDASLAIISYFTTS